MFFQITNTFELITRQSWKSFASIKSIIVWNTFFLFRLSFQNNKNLMLHPVSFSRRAKTRSANTMLIQGQDKRKKKVFRNIFFCFQRQGQLEKPTLNRSLCLSVCVAACCVLLPDWIFYFLLLLPPTLCSQRWMRLFIRRKLDRRKVCVYVSVK